MSEAATHTEPIDIQATIRRFKELRGKRDHVAAETKKMLKLLDADLIKLENTVLQYLHENGMQRATVDGITFHRLTQSQTSVADWEVLLNFIREKALWHFLNRSVSKTAVLEFQGETGELPPGVNLRRIDTVGFKTS